MIKNNYICGVDIGTHTTRVVVMGKNKDKNLCILAVGSSPTLGVRLGYITNIDLATESVRKAIKQAEDIFGSKIKRVCVSIGGINISSIISTGSTIISKADQEITHLDKEKAIDSSEENIDIINKKIIHIIPIGYKLDGKEIYGRPEGMRGVKLEAKTFFVTCLKQNIEDIATIFALLKIEIEDIIASPIATSETLLSTRQKMAGCALIDIGAETVTMIVFENNLPISLQVFPIGSMDITKDIALGLRISLEEAESIKIGSVIGTDFSKKKIEEIIEARLSDIFELIGNHLKRIKRNELLPAGIIITGGGSYINKIEEIAKSELKLPVRIGPTDTSITNKFKIRDISWHTAIGLVVHSIDTLSSGDPSKMINNNINQIKKFFKSIFSQLLP